MNDVRLSLGAMVGRPVILNPRGSLDLLDGINEAAWGNNYTDRLTGFALSFIIDPIICHRSVIRPEFEELLSAAGVPRLGNDIVYGSSAELEGILRESEPKSVWFQHAFPAGQHEQAYAVRRELLVSLNDKGALDHWVNPELVPHRRTLDVLDLSNQAEGLPYPCVLKASTSKSLGNGMGITFATSVEDVRLLRTTPQAERYVIEEHLDIRENWCVALILETEGVQVMGASQQLTNGLGQNIGNLYGPEAPAAVLGAAADVGRRAHRAGYRGVAGLDVVIDDKGRTLVIDLNFRFNASTVLSVVARRQLIQGALLRREKIDFESLDSRQLSSLTELILENRIWPIGLASQEDGGWTFTYAGIGHDASELRRSAHEVKAIRGQAK